MMPTLEYLIELMDAYKKQTPSAPDWYRAIDVVVGTLLAIEIQRAKDRALADESPF